MQTLKYNSPEIASRINRGLYRKDEVEQFLEENKDQIILARDDMTKPLPGTDSIAFCSGCKMVYWYNKRDTFRKVYRGKHPVTNQDSPLCLTCLDETQLRGFGRIEDKS